MSLCFYEYNCQFVTTRETQVLTEVLPVYEQVRWVEDIQNTSKTFTKRIFFLQQKKLKTSSFTQVQFSCHTQKRLPC